MIIEIRNVQRALPEALWELSHHGYARDSRNGPVVKFPGTVITRYERPEERVMFWPDRDANPFFHLFESLWMLGGRNDVKFVADMVQRMRTFSDDGKTLHGAYGHRWLKHFQFDQLEVIIAALKKNPDDRRAVLTMWDPRTDLGRDGKDVPCNLQALFAINGEGELDMSVTCRSNDMVWGAYGANAVHFSILQEYMALSIGVPLGVYEQISMNLHAYADTLAQVEPIRERHSGVNALAFIDDNDPYSSGKVEPFPLMSVDKETWDQDLDIFLDQGPIVGFRDPFFRRVVTPMWSAYRAFKEIEGIERYEVALEILEQCRATDWKLAAQEWILRRQERFMIGRDA